jgi:RNA polymerase-interacting CarD/CdnL/TRCF family regulator
MAARNKKKDFEVGNWIVHPIYGVGQISRIEEKCVNETTCAYFRVEADETTYWIPVDCVEDSRVRKVISRSAFRRAVRLLKKKPEQMDANYKQRQSRIKKVLSEGLLRATIRLVRDLWARNRKKNLNDTERTALRKIMDNLAAEWAVVESITPKEATQKMTNLLNQNQAQASTEDALDPIGKSVELA